MLMLRFSLKNMRSCICMCVCMCMCVHVYVYACVSARECVRVR